MPEDRVSSMHGVNTSEKAYIPPKGSQTEFSLSMSDNQELHYTAQADFILLRKHEKPIAEIFHLLYEKKDALAHERAITFLFNGGPGAASAFLHLGTAGPKRVIMNDDGSAPKPPSILTDNGETWLTFTDLVFIDPVGTGFSRVIQKNTDGCIEKEGDVSSKGNDNESKEFFQLNRDLESLCEFIQKFLSKHNRWDSPIFIAGESYGGFRVAKLVKLLQQGFGIGLNGVILISPVLELSLLNRSDYDILSWSDLFPTMAAISSFHGKSQQLPPDTPMEELSVKAEDFTNQRMVSLLAHANSKNDPKYEKLISEMSAFLGISQEIIRISNCRITPQKFSRELLKDEMKVCGLYDGTITVFDPYPDREIFEGPDPTSGIERVFTSGINTHLRKILKVSTDRDYVLFSDCAFDTWKNEAQKSVFENQAGAMDELVYGMVLNPHMRVLICHGYYDLITPYYSSSRMVNLLKLDKKLKDNILLAHFKGGHMFYTWKSSRIKFYEMIEKWYAQCQMA